MALTAKGNKKLTITLLTMKEPKFDFEGEWAGRDIQLVARTIVRAYRKVQLAARQEAKAANPTIGGISSPTGQAYGGPGIQTISENLALTPAKEE